MNHLARLTALATVLLAFAAPTASASGPIRDCPEQSGYFLQSADAYPATSAVDAKGNQDGWVCVKSLNTPDNAHVGFVIIDDRVAS
jgi:hypothetical protein